MRILLQLVSFVLPTDRAFRAAGLLDVVHTLTFAVPLVLERVAACAWFDCCLCHFGFFLGRGEWIRTTGLLLPKQAL